jgi:hypothetical protein
MLSRRQRVVEAAVRTAIEVLEDRRLLTVSLGQPMEPASIAWPSAVTRAVVNPSVTAVRPANGATGVRRDAFVATDLSLPNGGLDPATVIVGNVTLVRASDNAPIAGAVDTSGGGDAITFTPSSLLASNTKYKFTVTSNVKDVSGVPMTPFTSTFTTGTAGGPSNSSIGFTKTPQAVSQQKYTCVTTGPDGKLYAASYDGYISRWDVASNGTLSNQQTFNVVNPANGMARTITGIVFDPSSTASNLVAWVTHTQEADLNGSDFTGKISRLSGANLGTYKDYVTGLPRSVRDHLTNQATFGPDGKLYVAQAANTAMGQTDTSWGNRQEHLMTAAILRVDLAAIAAKGTAVNVRTIDAGGTYNPYASGAPVTLYATGVRNAYDLVWATNGHLYAPTNGSAAGGSTPASVANSGRRPPTGSPYTGPSVPGITNVPVTEHDWLFDIVKDKYYGHPNPSRGQFVFNGGNPTSGTDFAELTKYPVGTMPDPAWKKASYDFGQNYSPDGVIQYKSSTFGGALKGKLLVVRYSGGDDIIVLSPNSDGTIDSTKTLTGLAGMNGFNDPVDLTEYFNKNNASDPRNGMIFVAEFGGTQISLLKPGTQIVGAGGTGAGGPATVTGVSGTSISLSKGALVFNAPHGKTSQPAKLTITNKGSSTLTISKLAISGGEAASFKISTGLTLPKSIAPGASVTIALTYTCPSNATLGIHVSTLTITSNDATKASISLPLRAVATAGTGGTNEPSLQRLFDLYQLNIATGDKNVGDTYLFTPTAPIGSSEEVYVQRLVKANSTSPITIQPLASFAGGSPVVKFGYYTPGSTSNKTQLLSVGSADAQTVDFSTTGASTTFDPGSNPFGLYATFPIFNNTAYSEDQLNTHEATGANRRKVRFYPLKDASGNVIDNAYVFTSEDFTNDSSGSYDTQDFVGIIRNVKVAYSGGLEAQALDASTFPDRLEFNRINVQPPAPQKDANGVFYNPPPNVVHDTATVRITNSTAAAATISSITLNSTTVWSIVSGPSVGSVLQPGQSADITVKFIATKAPTTTVNETIDPTGNAKNYNGTYTGSLTVNATSSAGPLSKVVQLAGYFQNKNEADQEPNLSTQINKIFGYTTKVLNTGQVLAQGGKATAVGEEIMSGYWQKADTTQPVSVRQLSAYHTQGNTATFMWYGKTALTLKPVTTQVGVEGQSIEPHGTTGQFAAATFNPSESTFGFKIDTEWSDDTKNKQEQAGGGYGHHVRFFPARDRNGNLIPDTYIVGMDYLGINYDYQDNLFLVSNIKAANGATPNPGSGGPTLSGLTLMDAATDAAIGDFTSGTTIDVSAGKTYTVKATAGSGTIGSVVFAIDGTVVHTEGATAPYSIAGENGTDLLPWSVPTGSHTLTVTAFSAAGGTGTMGTPITVNFTASDGVSPPVSPPPPPASNFGVTGLTLVDAATDQDIGPVTSGMTIDFTGGKQYSVRADVEGATKSAVFKLDGATIRTESSLPFSIAGDQNPVAGTNDADYLPWSVANGAHTLAVTGFDATGGGGNAGEAVTFSINVTGVSGTPIGAGGFTGVNVNSATGSTTAGVTGTWTVKGAGAGFTGIKDQFHFAQQIRSGDFDVKAKLAALDAGSAGMVIRTGTAGGNSEVAIQLSGGTIQFITRSSFGATISSTDVISGAAGNLWFRIKRVGTTVTAYYGSDGSTWTNAGSINLTTLASDAWFGFAVAGTTTATARFESATG